MSHPRLVVPRESPRWSRLETADPVHVVASPAPIARLCGCSDTVSVDPPLLTRGFNPALGTLTRSPSEPLVSPVQLVLSPPGLKPDGSLLSISVLFDTVTVG